MPWYEPSSSAPRYRGGAPRRAEEEEEWGDDNNGGRQNTNNNNHTAEQNSNIISLQDYLDVHWLAANNHHDENMNNNNNDSSSAAATTMAMQQSQINFDPLQYRVEHQLGAAIFPTVASSSSSNFFAPLNSSLYQTNHFNNNIHHGNNSTNMNGGGSNDRMSTAAALPSFSSKAAQFFHPRKVMALCQYEGFFSPLDVSYNDTNTGRQEEQQVNGMMAEDGCNNDHGNGNGAMNEFDLSNNQHQHPSLARNESLLDDNNHGIQIQPRNLFVAGQDNSRSNDNYYNGTTMAAANDDQYNSSSFYKKDKVPSIQATLRQDPRTGQLATSLYDGRRNNNSSNSNISKTNLMGGGKASSWENYGGRPLMDENVLNVNGREGEVVGNKQNEKKKKKKKKKAKKKSKDDGGGGGERNEQQRIDSMFQRKMTGADDGTGTKSDGDGGGGAKKKKSNKTKKKKKKRSFTDASCELTIPTANQVDNNNNNIMTSIKSTNSTKAKLTEQDFEGMTNTMNAAQCMEGLQQFLSRVGQESYVAWTMIFLDPLCHYRQYATDTSSSSTGNNKRRKRSKKFILGDNTDSPSILLECTTPFLPSNKRYCTDKGPQCTAWNCTCDDQIRAMRGGAPLLGAMFVLNKRDDDEDEEGGVEIEEGKGGEKECYLLPLGPTEKCLEDLDVGYSRMKSWPVIPFDCEVSLSDRWSAFEAIISNQQRKMVTYNATTALMPFYYHQFHDECSMSAIDGESSQISQMDYTLSSSQFTSCLTKTQEDNPHFQRPANLRSIWDLRLVSWMLRPDVSDDQLEWSIFKSGFSHLRPDSAAEFYDGMPIVSRGLTEARTDLALLHSLFPLINEQLIRLDLLRSLENIEAPVQSILTSMECRGVGFYPQRLKKVEAKLSARIDALEARSRAVTQDSDFLLSSPQQVSQYLFDTLKLNVPEGIVSKTKSSHRSTSEEALKAIKADAVARTGSAPEILDIILEFRTLNKLLTTYIRPLPRLCVRGEGKSKKTPSKIHPQWMMTAVRTGRLSCRKPNLQQLPSDAVFGVQPRDAFVPSAREGMCVFACDYSQKEVRILAHMSNDEALISLFRGDTSTDIYKQMASLIRNKPAESITSEERAQFKQVTLALLYGMSPNQVAKKLSISKAAAQQTMNDFFRRFRRVKSWMEETKQAARRDGYVLTIAGRRRYLNDIRSDDNGKRSQAERQAINTVIQGSAADLMKTAMIQLSENLQSWEEGTRPKMVLQIHDEVLLELCFKEGDIKKMQAIAVKSCCRDCEELFRLKVPLLLKCSCGLSFGSMKDI